MFRLLLGLTFILGGYANTKNPNYTPGRTTFVHLFEWKWTDIAIECETFLGPYGYGGVQVSPANENAILWEPQHNRAVKRPWYERYQPVSYKFTTRSGNENEFIDMVKRCNKANVRIYVDVVVNHMTGGIGSGHGTSGSFFDSDSLRYDGVPFGPLDFNTHSKCSTHSGDIENYGDANQVRNCRLSGLKDLDISKDYVVQKISEYLNKLISYGVAGFRIDAAKHMWPHELNVLLGKLNTLNTSYFNADTKPFIFQEVIDMGGEPIKGTDYTYLGRVTDFKFGKNLGDVIRKNGNQRLKYLKNFGQGWGMLPSDDALVFVDNHDNQRGHGAGGFGSILTHFETKMYKMATAFMLAWPYGVTRIMSSYNWPRFIKDGVDINDWIGPPADSNYNTLPVLRNDDLTCGNGWVCEHRWRQIYNMVQFRNVIGFAPLTHWWDNDYQQIAFGRGNRGFVAFNNEVYPLNVNLQTGLPAGRYCDVISGKKHDSECTGRYIDVDHTGHAHVFVDNNWDDPMIAVHVESKL